MTPRGDPKSHYHSYVQSEEGSFGTIATIGDRKVITLYTHNRILFAACTLQASPRDRQYTQEGSREVWHFYDAALMRKHVEANRLQGSSPRSESDKKEPP